MKVCPRCRERSSDDAKSCSYCGWELGRYAKFQTCVVPVKKEGEVAFKDRIYVKMRKISQMRPKDREMYVRILEFLKENRRNAYSTYELRQLMVGLPDTKGLMKVLRWMTRQGILKEGMFLGDRYYAYDVEEW